MAQHDAPCTPWTSDERVRACCGGLDPDYDLTFAIQFVSEILFRLSGRQFPGVCEQTVWPCQASSCGGHEDPTWSVFSASDWHYYQHSQSPGIGSGYPSFPYKTGGGGWANCWTCGESISGGICGGGCNLPWLVVPGPIIEVLDVVVGGQRLSPDSYVVENGRRIGRIDGGTWPCSNDLTDTTVAEDPTVTAAVDGDGGVWGLSLTVDGVVTDFVFDASDDADAVSAAMAVAYGDGVVGVSGGPADVGATSPFVLSFDVFAAGESVTATSDASGLTAGLGPGSISTSSTLGSLPGSGAWYVTYRFGKPVPPGGEYVASIFACQVALARCGSDNCVLPARIKEVVREGVTLTMADPLEFIGKGEVGIYEVDLWLNSVNPHKIQRRASVYRADAAPPPKRFP